MTQQSINEDLMKAISSFNLAMVQVCIEKGADPNYTLFKDEDEPNSILQPTTPLRLVMFRISDCMLEDNDLKEFKKIAELLLNHGADPKPAMQIAEKRYGKYNADFEKSPFMDVWHCIAKSY